MKAWVTGATGLVGSTLIDRLIERGDQVVALVRPASRARAARWFGKAQLVEGSLPFALNPFERAPSPDVVFHCAGLIHPETANYQHECQELHVRGTAQIAELARAHGARLVHVSSLGAIGHRHHRAPIDESTPCEPTDVYGASKLAAERELAALGASGLDWIALRPPDIYGPRSRGDLVLSIARSVARRRFVLIGDGRAPISCVYVGNLVEVMLHFGHAALPDDRVLLVDDGRPTSRLELARELAWLLGRSQSFLRLPRKPALYAALALARVCRALDVAPPLRAADIHRRTMAFPFRTDRMKRFGPPPAYALPDALSITLAWHRDRGHL